MIGSKLDGYMYVISQTLMIISVMLFMAVLIREFKRLKEVQYILYFLSMKICLLGQFKPKLYIVLIVILWLPQPMNH
jgi:hypothetical protein